MIAATGRAPASKILALPHGRLPGEPPPTLFEYLPENALLFIDESHQTVPQIGAMARGDHRRKITLAEYWLPPAELHRQPAAALQRMGCDAAAIGGGVGDAGTLGDGADRRRLLRAGDPPDGPHRSAGRDQAGRGSGRRSDHEAKDHAQKGYRTLVTTLTKRMAEDLTEFLHEAGLQVRYMHSDVETLERIELIRDLRLGRLRRAGGHQPAARGARHPGMRLVAILDADKEGFLRSETSLIQTIGRAPATSRAESSSMQTE
jgi:excinuclease ABC subunit B